MKKKNKANDSRARRCLFCDASIVDPARPATRKRHIESFLLTRNMLKENPSIVAYSNYLLNTNTFKLKAHTRICVQCMHHANQYAKIHHANQFAKKIYGSRREKAVLISKNKLRQSDKISPSSLEQSQIQIRIEKSPYIPIEQEIIDLDIPEEQDSFNQELHEEKDIPLDLAIDIPEDRNYPFNQELHEEKDIPLDLDILEEQNSPFNQELCEEIDNPLDLDIPENQNVPCNQELHEEKHFPLDFGITQEQEFSLDKEINEKLDVNLKQAFPVKQDISQDIVGEGIIPLKQESCQGVLKSELVPQIVLPNYKRIAHRSTYCIIAGCNIRYNLHKITLKIRIYVLKTQNLYIPYGTKVCQDHKGKVKFIMCDLNESTRPTHDTFSAEQIADMLDLLKYSKTKNESKCQKSKKKNKQVSNKDLLMELKNKSVKKRPIQKL